MYMRARPSITPFLQRPRAPTHTCPPRVLPVILDEGVTASVPVRVHDDFNSGAGAMAIWSA